MREHFQSQINELMDLQLEVKNGIILCAYYIGDNEDDRKIKYADVSINGLTELELPGLEYIHSEGNIPVFNKLDFDIRDHFQEQIQTMKNKYEPLYYILERYGKQDTIQIPNNNDLLDHASFPNHKKLKFAKQLNGIPVFKLK